MTSLEKTLEQQNVGHMPVLLRETLRELNVRKDHWYIDLTFGRGGHTNEILGLGGRVIAFDIDADAITFGTNHFAEQIKEGKLILVHANFEHLGEEITKLPHARPISGVLCDFGVSSNQLDTPERGFSFQVDAPLDMRMDDRLSVKAKDLVNGLGKRELFSLLTEFSQERHAKRIVDAILTARKKKLIETTQELASIIERAVHREGHLHPATKTFMALRMLVNDELGVIERMLPQAFEVLERRGRLVAISFHEGEDRLIKHFMKDKETKEHAMSISRKPVTASQDELEINSRSRSAKLRVLEKTV